MTEPGLIVTLTPELRAAIIRRAEQFDTNMRDIVGSILASAFDIDYKLTQRATSPQRDGGTLRLNIRLSHELKDAIVARALRERTDQSSLIREIVADNLGVERPARSQRRFPGGGGRR